MSERPPTRNGIATAHNVETRASYLLKPTVPSAQESADPTPQATPAGVTSPPDSPPELTATKVVGLLLGFAGIVAVSSGGLLDAAGEVTLVGVVSGVASALAWAMGTVGFKKYEARISTLWAIALPFLAGGAALTVLGLFIEPLSGVSWSGPLFSSVLYSAFIGTGLAWMLFFGLVRAGEASRVASFIFVVPLAAVVIGAVVLDEALGLSLLAGAALIVSGIYLVNRTPRGTKRAAG